MTISNIFYRIAWKSDLTNYSGHGTYIFNKKEASEYVKELNTKYNKEIFHWIEEKKNYR